MYSLKDTLAFNTSFTMFFMTPYNLQAKIPVLIKKESNIFSSKALNSEPIFCKKCELTTSHFRKYNEENCNVTRNAMATIKEVAKLAGVSPTTASYALNNRPEVKEETRKKVYLAAKQLCYVPNKLAQGIRNGKSNTIMVITSENIESGNTFSAEFLGILAGARSFNYDVLVKLVDSQNIDDDEIERLIGSFSDGYLLLGNHLDAVARVLTKRNCKCVMLSSHTAAPVLQVNSDGKMWMKKMTEHVIERGRDRPAYFCYETATTEELLRYKGYCEAVDEKIPGQKLAAFCCGPNGSMVEEQLRQSISSGCDAIICWNDVLATQVIDTLSVLGYSVPGPIAVTGFDDNLSYPNSVYRLTTVRQEFRLKGQTAVKELVAQIDADQPNMGDIFVPCSIVDGNTL